MTLTTTPLYLWSRIRLPLAAVSALLAAMMLILGSRPVTMTVVEFPLLAIQPENELRSVAVEWPAKVGMGEDAALRLRLTAEPSLPDSLPPEVLALNDIYQGVPARVEARLDLPGVDLQPPGAITQPLQEGEQTVFIWRITPQQAGTVEGTLWLYLTSSSGARQTVLARNIRIESQVLLGLRPSLARWVGYGLFMLALVLAMDAIGRAAGQILARWRRPEENA